MMAGHGVRRLTKQPYHDQAVQDAEWERQLPAEAGRTPSRLEAASDDSERWRFIFCVPQGSSVSCLSPGSGGPLDGQALNGGAGTSLPGEGQHHPDPRCS